MTNLLANFAIAHLLECHLKGQSGVSFCSKPKATRVLQLCWCSNLALRSHQVPMNELPWKLQDLMSQALRRHKAYTLVDVLLTKGL
jgi:hypothetical protein